MGGVVEVDNSRLAAVETDVKHLSKDVGEIKSELTEFRAIHVDIAKSLSRLTVIAEQNQHTEEKIEPRFNMIFDRLRAIERKVWTAAGMITVAAAVFGVFSQTITKALGL